ncbi:MAG TPA: cell division protein FtsA, partial [Gemmatimonadaceae bacterium]|nr:cell division protein FtsA [Gemmatimonadaceae bacterium]
MTTDPIVAALDIGTAYTTALVASVGGDLPRTPMLRVLGVGQARTQGLRRGVVSDIEEATRSIRKAMDEAQRLAGVTADAVYVGIA